MLREILTVVSYLMIALTPTITDKQSPNQSPVANADTYTVHGLMLPLSPQVTANDYDPDGDPIFVKEVIVPTQHGNLSRLAGNDLGIFLPLVTSDRTLLLIASVTTMERAVRRLSRSMLLMSRPPV